MAETKAPKRTRASKKKEEMVVEAVETTVESTKTVSESKEIEEEKKEEKVVEEVKPVEVNNVTEENFDEDALETPDTFEKGTAKERSASKEKEVEDLERKIAVSNLLSDEEERLNKRLVEAGRKVKKELYSDSVIPLRDKVQYKSDSLIRKEEYLALAESLRTNKPLYGTVVGSMIYDGHVTAIVKYGSFFRVLIPFDMFTNLTKDDLEFIESKGNNKNVIISRQRLRVDQRLFSEVDFIVGKIDEENAIAVADRKAAMARKKIGFFFAKDRYDNYIINQGQKAEVRIVRTSENYLIAEMYGVEFRISAQDIAPFYIHDVSKMFSVGDTAPAKIMMLERKKNGKKYSLSVKISLKEAMDYSRLACFNFYPVGARVTGVVSGIESYGVFVRLENKDGVMDVLCTFNPNSKEFKMAPPIGSKVSAVITGKNEETLQLNGRLSKTLQETE